MAERLLPPQIAGWFDGIPVLGTLFGPPVNGSSFFTAGMILALMIIPIITWNDLSYSLGPNNASQTRGVTTEVPGAVKLNSSKTRSGSSTSRRR